jgi:hypothetical protein
LITQLIPFIRKFFPLISHSFLTSLFSSDERRKRAADGLMASQPYKPWPQVQVSLENCRKPGQGPKMTMAAYLKWPEKERTPGTEVTKAGKRDNY